MEIDQDNPELMEIDCREDAEDKNGEDQYKDVYNGEDEDAENSGEENREEEDENTEDEKDEDEDGDDEDRYDSEMCSKCRCSNFNQDELSDMFRDCGLSKQQSEYITSRLKEKKMITKETRVSFYRNRDVSFRKFFLSDDSLVYSCDIEGLINEYGKEKYDPKNWRLFIDSSTKSLKAVLLHNGNELATIPFGYSMTMTESYADMAYLLKKIDYYKQKWKICTDLKVVLLY